MVSSSIFGSEGPKIVFDLGGENETTVILGKWVTTADEPDSLREIINESELEDDRDIISLGGEFWKFEGFVHLHKYSDPELIRSKFEEIYQFNRQNVVLYKHKDGNYFKDTNGDAVLWKMNCFPKNYQPLDYRDLLIVQFRSLKGVDFSDSSTIVVQPSEIIIEGGAVI